MNWPLTIACASIMALVMGAALMRFKMWLFNAPCVGLERTAVYVSIGLSVSLLGIFGPARGSPQVMCAVWISAGAIAAALDPIRRLLPSDDDQSTL